MKLLFSILLLGIFQLSFGNDISFVVYHSKGSVVKTFSQVNLKKGDPLFLKDAISLGTGSSLILICSNYKIIQLSKKGNYTIKSLMGQCDKNPASYSSSYFKYVWDELTHPHDKPEMNPEAYMKNIGAVSRGCNESAIGIKADTINYCSGSLPVFWWSSYKNSYAVVYEQILDGAPVKKLLLIKEKPVQLHELFKALVPGEYYWQIAGDEGSGCERNYLKIWDKPSYNKAIKLLLKEVPVSSAAETAYARAFLLEENHFLAEALQYYQQAAQLNPSNIIYKKSLAKFYETNF